MLACALTDKGKVRAINQDYFFSSPDPVGPLDNLFLVADGMGGHKAGDVASHFLIDSLVEWIRQTQEESAVSLLKMGIMECNDRLYYLAANDNSLYGMGTTLVAATIKDGILYTANIGDSRLYLIREETCIQITKDHSYVEEMVSLGKLDRNSQYYQSKKNIITRAVGTEQGVRADFFETELRKGDYILLCSDGLSNMVEESRIAEIVASQGLLKHKADQLIAEANENGGRDNIAVVLVNPQVSEVKGC